MTCPAFKKILVLGDGAWGSAIAALLANTGRPVTVWGPFPDQIAAIAASNENTPFLPGVSLPRSIQWTANKADIVGADLIVSAVPTRYLHDVLDSLQDSISPDPAIVSLSKGLDPQSGERISRLLATYRPRASVAVLSGPSHAEEVARNIPTAVVVASEQPGLAARLQDLFTTPSFRVYTSNDLPGVEFGGAFKNIVAVAVGMCDGLGLGDNTKAALITRGLAEMSRLGCALGASFNTFAGLSGMGDLIVTCTSRLSRNRGVGERLGRGETLQDIMAGTRQAVEGVWTCSTALRLANKANVDVPIIRALDAILHHNKKPAEAVHELMTRLPKSEFPPHPF